MAKLDDVVVGTEVDYNPVGSVWVPARVETAGETTVRLRFACALRDVVHEVSIETLVKEKRIGPAGMLHVITQPLTRYFMLRSFRSRKCRCNSVILCGIGSEQTVRGPTATLARPVCIETFLHARKTGHARTWARSYRLRS